MKRFHDVMDDEVSLRKKVNLVETNPVVDDFALNVSNCNKTSRSDLVQLATEIQRADTFVHANACNKLQIIAQQIRFLHSQAERVLLEAKTNADLHHAACNFVKTPGSVYHLYKRPSGQKYLGMLSPEEWQSPHEFLGSYRLENDQSWTPIQRIAEKDNELSTINKILSHTDGVYASRSIQDVENMEI